MISFMAGWVLGIGTAFVAIGTGMWLGRRTA